ncbi:MAG TPA: hypothetical protein VF114_05580 [Candidatus Limnocylindria bacterium]
MQIWRYAFAATAVLFVAGVVVQILLAGWGVTGLGGQGMNNHIQFGYWLSLAPVIPLILAWPARAGRQTVAMCAVLLVITFVQTLLPSTAPGRANIPWIAALHPITAFVVLGLGIMVARRAVALARSEPVPAAAAEEPASATPQA